MAKKERESRVSWGLSLCWFPLPRGDALVPFPGDFDPLHHEGAPSERWGSNMLWGFGFLKVFTTSSSVPSGSSLLSSLLWPRRRKNCKCRPLTWSP